VFCVGVGREVNLPVLVAYDEVSGNTGLEMCDRKIRRTRTVEGLD
jgi:hypothetical protein